MIFLLISLGASVIGAICGIGGGVLMKPLMEMLSLGSVTVLSFLSSCTVLSMSSYSVGTTLIKREGAVDVRRSTPLAIGSALGGVAGNILFNAIKDNSSNTQLVSIIQSISLAIITLGVLIYTIFKEKVKTYQVDNLLLCALIGFILGVVSSFLGIGGGPLNLAVLYFFFSMKTKEAAQNSLYIILFSQAASILLTVLTSKIPSVSILILVLMILGGISGGIIGRKINKTINEKTVRNLFIALMIIIILICCYNAFVFCKA